VLATDWSPKMIEHFNARVRAEGLDAEGRVMDCHALDLRDDSYDITGSIFGVMLVPDQPRALREMVRVTKPGGRVLLIAYGDPAEFETLHVFVSAAQAVVPEFEGPPEDEPLLEFQVADPDVCGNGWSTQA
jgi:ubiquinone/menaquinone biosynthesis C-methylase UbiE